MCVWAPTRCGDAPYCSLDNRKPNLILKKQRLVGRAVPQAFCGRCQRPGWRLPVWYGGQPHRPKRCLSTLPMTLPIQNGSDPAWLGPGLATTAHTPPPANPNVLVCLPPSTNGWWWGAPAGTAKSTYCTPPVALTSRYRYYRCCCCCQTRSYYTKANLRIRECSQIHGEYMANTLKQQIRHEIKKLSHAATGDKLVCPRTLLAQWPPDRHKQLAPTHFGPASKSSKVKSRKSLVLAVVSRVEGPVVFLVREFVA